MVANYSEDSIKTLEWKEHIRKRPGMYIGKLGDGTSHDDGIYILIKEVIDNSIDEFAMGFGKNIDITIEDQTVCIRDYGRGIPLGKLVEAASKMNTGAKYDSKVFKKSVGLNGVGIKAVNALSGTFVISAIREGKCRKIEFQQGNLITDYDISDTKEANGTIVCFTPDKEVFGEFKYKNNLISSMLRNYVFLNSGLTINFNGEKYISKNGLYDLLSEKLSSDGLYPIIHLKNGDLEIALTHGTQYSEEYYSFVNGQHTTQGGTHLSAFKESYVKTVKDFFRKDFDSADVRQSLIAAISIKIEEPVFESQTKTKLGSKDMAPDGISIRQYVNDFIKNQLDNYLHKNSETANILLKKIQSSEKERKAIAGIKKLARERSKKVSLHNKKLRDCRVHFNSNDERRLDSTIFITEGDSASGSITKARDVNTQAVFSLRGKPLNSYGLTKKIVYENEEFNALQAALNIEEGLENLRYRNIVIATDADVDGMHIRLLIITFFLQFFPELIKNDHLFILDTPLFRARNKNETIYCYNYQEKQKAVERLKGNVEITRFKGLGEISPDEFQGFIGKKIRLDPITLTKADEVSKLLEFYMGKNTPERQEFIIDNLRVEEELEETVI
ncbi:MAG TPA: DNA topoisomerase IV subunit B [Bacteroidales bacterium]|jgi:topoisomerase-4 subunit B|nr:DNA topoisomerase IV subunit B [Bacteroidales bacterium]HRW21433.1 DNA topoisomerase IV subunit B [Bacteroidales bacterium]HXK81676.1 DNA topoisomerase IV subunit B [Bacteroidales bacterium]